MGTTTVYYYVTDNNGNICTDNDGNLIYWDYQIIVTPDGVLAVSTVNVYIVNGVYQPCKSCHWYTECVVPRGQHHAHIKQGAIRPVFQCQEYTSRKPPLR